MNKFQNAWYDMYLEVIAICDTHESVWEEKAHFANPYNAFVANQVLIDAALVRQMMNTTGYTDDKNSRRAELIEQVKLFSAVLSSYADTNNLGWLKKAAFLNPSEIDRMETRALIGFARILTEKTTPLIASLADLDMTPAKLTAFNTMQSTFISSFDPQVDAKKMQQVATKELDKLFRKNNAQLGKLDIQALVLAPAAAQFHQLYTAARLIDDAPTRTRALTIHIADEDGGTAISRADVKIMPSGLQRKCSAQGNMYVQHLNAGEVSILCSKPGYSDKTVTAYIADGETTRTIVLMNKK